MNSSFGIVQSVLCSSPVRPIAPGCVYGQIPAISSAAAAWGTEPQRVLALDYIDAVGPLKLDRGLVAPNLITLEEGQEKRRKKEERAAAANGNGNGGLHPAIYLGGLGVAVALGVGVFYLVRRRRQK